MAFPKKNRRRIVVDDQEYFWYAAGNECINLRVMADVPKGQQIWCTFGYHQDAEPLLNGGVRLTNQFVVTPYIVRQAIEYGLSRGWTPLSGAGVLALGPSATESTCAST